MAMLLNVAFPIFGDCRSRKAKPDNKILMPDYAEGNSACLT